MEIIDGRKIAADILESVKVEVSKLTPKPKLAIVLANEDESSHTFVRLKMKRAEEVGIETKLFHYGKDVTIDELISEIRKFKNNIAITGVLVQVPLFDHLQKKIIEILNTIDPSKDVDGLTAYHLGRTVHLLDNTFIPATVEAILESLNFCFEENLTWNNIQKNHSNLKSLIGKNVLIINNSNLIGKPLTQILTELGATVTVANVFTKDLGFYTRNSDVIVSATSKTNIISGDMIKQGAILIDVTSEMVEGTVKGDFIIDEELKSKASFLTPVPGGVGPLTIACLLRNMIRG